MSTPKYISNESGEKQTLKLIHVNVKPASCTLLPVSSSCQNGKKLQNLETRIPHFLEQVLRLLHWRMLAHNVLAGYAGGGSQAGHCGTEGLGLPSQSRQPPHVPEPVSYTHLTLPTICSV
eukprot:2662618-Rhodomonas_salina.1